MPFPFKKKQTSLAMAEVLEDGRAAMNQELSKAKYNQYEGAVPTVEIAVRVQPENEPPFEARMKAEITLAFLLKPGVRVQVRYETGQTKKATLEDENQAILDRNPQLIKKA